METEQPMSDTITLEDGTTLAKDDVLIVILGFFDEKQDPIIIIVLKSGSFIYVPDTETNRSSLAGAPHMTAQKKRAHNFR